MNRSRAQFWTAGALTAAMTAAFMLMWWNRAVSANATDGFWYYTAKLLEKGLVPYRDFATVLPPLHMFKTAAALQLFGDYLIAPRAVGVLERIALAVVVFLCMSRLVPAARAFLFSFTAVAIAATGTFDPVSDYVASSSLLLAAALYACMRASAAGLRGRGAALWLAAAGAFSGLAVLERQNSGLIATACFGAFLAAAAARRNGASGAAAAAGAFAAGWALPVGAWSAWIAAAGGLRAFLQQTLLEGPTAKGDLLSTLTRPLHMTWHSYSHRQEAAAALLLLAGAFAWIRFWRGRSEPDAPALWPAALVSAVAVVSGAALAAWEPGAPERWPRLESLIFVASYVCLFGSAALAAWAMWTALRRRLTDTETEWGFAAAAGFGIAYGNSLSWAPYEPIMVVALPLLLALISRRFPPGLPGYAGRAAVAASCGILIAVSVTYKNCLPFEWQGWREPAVSRATVHPSIPELRGIRVSPETAAVLERLTNAMRRHAAAGEPVFAFPYFPLLYALSDREPPTFSRVHFVDVLPDSIARRDADALRRNPPAVVVVAERTAAQMRASLSNFQTSRSGLDELLVEIDRMSARYDLVDTVALPTTGKVVKVFARPRETVAEAGM